MLIIVVVCGIPGSGKSGFCNSFKSRQSICCSHICFDDFEVQRGIWDSSTFDKSRQAALSAVQIAVEAQHLSPGRSLIIVDDLMYLHSMRRQIYVIGRKVGAVTVVLCVKTPLEMAIQRNILRPPSARVDEATIRRIFEHFEYPNVKYTAERISLVVDGASAESIMEGTTVLEKVLDDAWENYSALVTSKQDHSTTTVKENHSNTNQNLERSLRKVSSSVMSAITMLPLKQFCICCEEQRLRTSQSSGACQHSADAFARKKKLQTAIGEILSSTKKQLMRSTASTCESRQDVDRIGAPLLPDSAGVGVRPNFDETLHAFGELTCAQISDTVSELLTAASACAVTSSKLLREDVCAQNMSLALLEMIQRIVHTSISGSACDFDYARKGQDDGADSKIAGNEPG